MTSPTVAAAGAAASRADPETVRAFFFISAPADPGLLPRLIEPVAKRRALARACLPGVGGRQRAHRRSAAYRHGSVPFACGARPDSALSRRQPLPFSKQSLVSAHYQGSPWAMAFPSQYGLPGNMFS